MFGTCFGHQVIAKALGGKVAENPCGRYVCHTEKIVLREDVNNSKFVISLMNAINSKPFRMFEAHCECIQELPANAKSVASSESCKHEIVLFSDNIIASQSHADLDKSDLTDIILPELLQQNNITKEEFDYAHESFKQLNAASEVSIAIRDFLNS